MQYSKILAAALCVAAHGSALSADSSWDGFYMGLTLDAARTNATIAGTAGHSRKSQAAGLGAYAGFNRSTNSGLVWGGEIGLSSAENTPNLSTGALGTTEFNGKFVINPRLRAGFATGNLFLYGTAGVAISDAVVRSAVATTKDYTMGVSYGIGAEMKIGNGWSTRLDLTRTDLGQKNQSFNGLTRDTNVKMDKITIGLTKSF